MSIQRSQHFPSPESLHGGPAQAGQLDAAFRTAATHTGSSAKDLAAQFRTGRAGAVLSLAGGPSISGAQMVAAAGEPHLLTRFDGSQPAPGGSAIQQMEFPNEAVDAAPLGAAVREASRLPSLQYVSLPQAHGQLDLSAAQGLREVHLNVQGWLGLRLPDKAPPVGIHFEAPAHVAPGSRVTFVDRHGHTRSQPIVMGEDGRPQLGLAPEGKSARSAASDTASMWMETMRLSRQRRLDPLPSAAEVDGTLAELASGTRDNQALALGVAKQLQSVMAYSSDNLQEVRHRAAVWSARLQDQPEPRRPEAEPAPHDPEPDAAPFAGHMPLAEPVPMLPVDPEPPAGFDPAVADADAPDGAHAHEPPETKAPDRRTPSERADDLIDALRAPTLTVFAEQLDALTQADVHALFIQLAAGGKAEREKGFALATALKALRPQNVQQAERFAQVKRTALKWEKSLGLSLAWSGDRPYPEAAAAAAAPAPTFWQRLKRLGRR
jgi:hypothetical protein